MELVYLINNKHDFDKFASIHPNATWADKGAFTFNYLQLLLGVPSVNLPYNYTTMRYFNEACF